MGQEIERKFLVNEKWKPQGEPSEIKQGYLNLSPYRTVRVRIEGNIGYLTIKGKTDKITRPEFEYEIPLDDAKEMMAMCEGSIIHKTRYRVYHIVKLWEVDVFHGDNEGLIVAECEMKHEGEFIALPEWAEKEVSHEHIYTNSMLSKQPFRTWSK